jgi:hypothetical protein
MVGGGVAAMFFGEPRTTLDIDVIIDVGSRDAEHFVAAFPTDAYYVPPVETIRGELEKGERGHFNIIDFATGLKADLYPAGTDELMRWGLDQAQRRMLGEVELVVAPAAYVIAMKLRYHHMSAQGKHLRDIRSMLSLAPHEIDRDTVTRWARIFGVEQAWIECQNRMGEE